MGLLSPQTFPLFPEKGRICANSGSFFGDLIMVIHTEYVLTIHRVPFSSEIVSPITLASQFDCSVDKYELHSRSWPEQFSIVVKQVPGRRKFLPFTVLRGNLLQQRDL